MPEDIEDEKYQIHFPIEGLRLKLGVHSRNPPHKPRIQWKIEDTGLDGDEASIRVPPDRSDFWLPYATLDVMEPRLVFGRDEDPRPAIVPESRFIDAEERETIALPNQLASDMRDGLEALGTVADNDQICADPSAFPAVIQSNEAGLGTTEWTPIGWEPDRKVMWYADRENHSPERSYQLEDGKLLWRRFDLTTPDEMSRQPINNQKEV